MISLIAALDAYQESLYPPEARHPLDIASLSQPHVKFLVARTSSGVAIGCGAVVFRENYAELKRMYVSPEHRGSGIASEILRTIEMVALEAGYKSIFLETGPYQKEAIRLYERHGYRECGAFGAYSDHPLSVFMNRRFTLNAPLPSAEA